MKLGHLILRKITKFVATRCQILRLKCTKFNFGWGSAPDPAGLESLQHSSDLLGLAGFKGPLLREGKGMGRKWECEKGRGDMGGNARGKSRSPNG